MKKITISALSVLLATGAAFADFSGPDVVVDKPAEQHANPKGGFVAGNETIVTVKQVNEMRDDVPVIVKGHILQRMGDEKYLFEDSTGSIAVEIDDDDWRGQTVKPTDTVKLYGDVDRGIFKTEIEVDYVEKM
ncbi:MAG: NirD/YgiW/YdeI family stress tolerance protein [Alphaproteobacteria bacterium]|nr:NirD/YgiW/YdeI family stress tolerance protein [Alphaproteobacteria bacterium]